MTSQYGKPRFLPRIRFLNRVVEAFGQLVHASDRVMLRASAQMREAMMHPLRPFPLAHVASGVGITTTSQTISAQETLLMRELHRPLGIAGLPPDTLQNAHAFLTLLPTWLPLPETRCQGHGQVALEWSGGGVRKFNVVIGQDGMLIYSARLGAKGRMDGAEPIADQLSPIVTHVIRQLRD